MKKTALVAAALLITLCLGGCSGLRSFFEAGNPSGEMHEQMDLQTDKKYPGAVESRYYYSRLDAQEKEAYELIAENVKRLAKTVYLPKLDEQQLERAFKAVFYDNPQIFWVKNNFGWGKDGDSVFIIPEYIYEKEECESVFRQVENVVREISEKIVPDMSDFEKELIVHDWLCANCAYADAGESAYTIVGALVNGQAVCEGYAKAAAMLLNRVGVECRVITGQAQTGSESIGHMWNIAKIDGENYHLDVTWDAQQDAGFGIHHAYFNLTDERIEADHSGFERKQTKCTAQKADFYKKQGLLADSYLKAEKLISRRAEELLKSGGGVLEIRLTDKDVFEQTAKLLFEEGRINNITEAAFSRAGVGEMPDNVTYILIEEQNVILCRIIKE